jgi:Aspartyl/Asparaginyl beta-hydroxylase
VHLSSILEQADGILSSGIPWLRLNLSFNHVAALSEGKRLLGKFVEHRKIGRGWKSLCLRGLASTLTESAEAFGIPEPAAPYKWTEIAEQCPVTSAFVKRLPLERFYRVRLMLLEPGGYIAPHIDNSTKGLHTMNVALNNPDGCFFKMEAHGIIPFCAGAVMLLDTSNRHSLVNLSGEPRLHLIVEGTYTTDNREWSELVCSSYKHHRT